ncbi:MULTISPECIES: alpha-hydroxy acid oxidase [Streptomyces]|uniref:alpha-hydroxy acid oxidase n=1 Tax=Streptomyces TaxID=1883 RepID=UPI000BB0E5A5|nr:MULTISPECIES: alpha-hydroxy acid oxidase [Streptomyces]MCX4433624.1 alpha-hydroxy-acid oxidizing protein [Streptomyces mirabilis]PBC99271.1 4-hydroxymandelate oxidase [Streptomyces sp. Ag82_O1-15]SOE75555.1 4-hydroxymandelate oxidase [Streptomyces sp. OV198]
MTDIGRWMDGLQERAAEVLPEDVYAYFRRGAGRGLSVAEATSAWDQFRFRARLLRDVSTCDASTTVLGTPVRTPVLVAPSTLQRRAHPDGEAATARGVAAAGSLLAVTSNTAVPFADLVPSRAPWWVQVYVARDPVLTIETLERALAAGARAVVLTADTPVSGARGNRGAQVDDFIGPEDLYGNVTGIPSPEAAERAPDLTLDVIGWLRERARGLPIVVKGVLRGDDARELVAAGASGLIVSNHGGRQLDGLVPTAWALPEVVDAVAGTGAEVYADGGLRRGTHILAALALGARAVFIGRPVLWALTVRGAAGVTRLIDDLTDELVEAMSLTGTPSVLELTRDLLWTGPLPLN